MKVKDLIKKLEIFDQDKEVIISDGHRCNFYKGDFIICMYHDCVDIGISGYEINDDLD